jgi:hypothetical protein
MLIDAVTINPVPVVPGILATPLLVSVSAIDNMSGSGTVLAVTRNVVNPNIKGAGLVFVHLKIRAISSVNVAVGVTENTKLWPPDGAISAGVFGEPTGTFWLFVV